MDDVRRNHELDRDKDVRTELQPNLLTVVQRIPAAEAPELLAYETDRRAHKAVQHDRDADQIDVPGDFLEDVMELFHTGSLR